MSSTDSTFSKKDYIQVEAMKNGQINIIASSETQSDIWAKTLIKWKSGK